jgi:hypothetical protein
MDKDEPKMMLTLEGNVIAAKEYSWLSDDLMGCAVSLTDDSKRLLPRQRAPQRPSSTIWKIRSTPFHLKKRRNWSLKKQVSMRKMNYHGWNTIMMDRLRDRPGEVSGGQELGIATAGAATGERPGGTERTPAGQQHVPTGSGSRSSGGARSQFTSDEEKCVGRRHSSSQSEGIS